MEPEKKAVKIRVPSNALVVAVGVSGSGKSSLSHNLFPGCVVSSDSCRRVLSSDISVCGGGEVRIKTTPTPSDELQKYSEGAFVLFHAWIRARLRHGLLTVADSTALRPEFRSDLHKIGQEEHVKVVYLFVDTPFAECVRRNAERAPQDRVPESVIKRQFASLNRSRSWLRKDDHVYTVKPGDEVEVQVVEGVLGIEAKAIDVVGDVHGCMDELVELIGKLGYRQRTLDLMEEIDQESPTANSLYWHPEGRKLVFVGDLIDRGPHPYGVLDFVRRHVQAGVAELVLSNHERKLRSYLSGRNVTIKPEFQKTIDSIPADADKKGLKSFLHSLRPYRQWSAPDGQEWVVVHAAFDPKFAGKIDGKIEEYCVYGPVNSVDPVTHRPDRIAWWESYRPGPKVVYGHVITDDGKPRVVNGTYGIDTGCVHGGSLTALRLPEQEFVQVKARRLYHGTVDYADKKKAEEGEHLGVLLHRRVTVRDQEGKTHDVFLKDRGLMDAIDALSTRTVSPDKLAWLSPTMSPGPISEDPSLMEDPVTAAKWMFANAPEGAALCAQVKHMGSRGTWLCEYKGDRWEIACWTRNGYEMFDEPRRSEVYEALQHPLTFLAAQLADMGMLPDTILLDSEVMPFNQHGAEWLERTFMQTAAAGHVSRFAMARAANAGGQKEQAQRLLGRMENLKLYGDAANRFCWPVGGVNDLKVGVFNVLYPFHDMAHGKLCDTLAAALRNFPVFQPTEYRLVHNTEESLDMLSKWFDGLTAKGLEGVVLKYDDPKVWSATKFPQQALKVRGKDYLRIIYGPQYLEPEILAALRKERRVDGKMRMAYQQTLLGREALARRFGENRPFEAWHECVIGILGAERATVDPRL